MTPSQINNNPTTTRLISAASSRILPVAIMVCGNIAFPQLFHLIPGGGPTWLPIYFFTLVSAWCYGWRAGIVTAILSPVANSLLFGMPAAEVLPAILMKSALLAAAASFAASRVRRASLATVAAPLASGPFAAHLSRPPAISASVFRGCCFRRPEAGWPSIG